MEIPRMVRPGQRVRLDDIDPSATPAGGADQARKQMDRERDAIAQLQHRLYAENRRALLIVLQGMDASGKDGVIRRVFSGVNPLGCQVTAFGVPSEEERDHDFLWRIYPRLPRHGNIAIFNRSHYEDVLAVRVRKLAPRSVWASRFDIINRFEALISELGTRVVKLYLHIDRDEQRERLLERLRNPAKRWKYQPGDLEDRRLWAPYQRAYEDALSKCGTAIAPWYIVPANKKWARDLFVARIVRRVLEDMDPRFPRKKVRTADVEALTASWAGDQRK